MTIPVTSSEVLAFTPESLKEVLGDDAPVFRLRAPSENHVRRFRQVCSDEGLTSYSDDEFTEEKMRAIDALWTPEDAAGLRDRLSGLLASIGQEIEVADEDLRWLDELDDTLFDNWRPLRVMRRKAGELRHYAPRLAVSTYVAGWSGLDAPFRLEGGYVPIAVVDELEKALGRIAEEHLGKERRGIPFIELYAAASQRVSLTGEEEKNSPAPSQPGSTPGASTDSPPTDGRSSGESGEAVTPSSNSRRKKIRAAA